MNHFIGNLQTFLKNKELDLKSEIRPNILNTSWKWALENVGCWRLIQWKKMEKKKLPKKGLEIE